MDNIRFGLLCGAAVICFFLYQAWQTDYAPTDAQRTAANSTQTVGSGDAPVSDSDVPDIAQAPGSGGNASSAGQGTNQGAGETNGATPQDVPGNSQNSPVAQGQPVHIVTDKLDVIIDTKGGDLREVSLRDVPLSHKQPDTNLTLINDSLPDFFIEQSGLVADGSEAPNHTTQYQSVKTDYEMADGQDTLNVPLTWTDASGHKVTKVYTFYRDSYKIGLDHRVTNGGDAPWSLSQYVRFWRAPHDNTGDVPFSHAFFGVGWYQKKTDSDNYAFETRGRDDLSEDPLSLNQTGGWVAMIQHYFIGAAIPPENAKVHYFARPKAIQGVSGGYATGFVGERQEVAVGATADFKTTLFIGPKFQDQMAGVAKGLDLTVDYGWFSVMAKPIFAVLEFLHSLVGNWGVAIILLTFLIKAVFYKLSEIQYRGMARMRKFQPRMAKLKEQYGDDKAELQKRMMELYKKEGFNPLAGCWPMLVQMPVFISLYWVLRESVELRHAPFMLWIQDLSAPDPYYILPVVFGVTMFLQQRLNANVTMDPMQQRIMQIMPIGMAVFFAFFPAGLVLYWCTNNVLSIAQQWWIYRKLDAEGLHRAQASS